MKRKEAKKEAAKIARTLVDLAASGPHGDLDISRGQAALARRLMLKFNLRYGWEVKRFYCHGCKKLIVPGANARVRLGPGRVLRVTCMGCGRVNRKVLPKTPLNIQR